MNAIVDTPDLSWQNDAQCVGVDPDLFFPERGASTRPAKTICRHCPVQVDCLVFAICNGAKHGIYGGTSERERRRIRRRLGKGWHDADWDEIVAAARLEGVWL